MKKRDCGIGMRLVPYGGGWTDVYADFGDGELYFIISNVMSEGFGILMRALYYLYPDQSDTEHDDLVECKEGIFEDIDGKYVVTRIVDESSANDPSCVYRPIPWRAEFAWDEEGAYSAWRIERDPTEDASFDLRLHIEIHREEEKEYDYTVRYEDLCYAAADACTKALKKHGFAGYHEATYTEDVNIRHLLFLKAVALGNTEARKIAHYREKGKGATSDFSKELELLLFDM